MNFVPTGERADSAAATAATPSTGPKRRRIRRTVTVILLVIGCLGLARIGLMLGGTSPQVGLVDGRLRDCPDSPNCVCSQADDPGHAIAPLRYSIAASDAWQRLRLIVEGLPRTHIVSADECYLHAEFTTAVFRFVDDVEFLLDAERGVIHVRSASRVGYSDLGANRKRVEAIREKFESDLQPPPLTGQPIAPAGSGPESP